MAPKEIVCLMAMTRGRPKTVTKRNNSGLRNQKTITPPSLNITGVGSDQESPMKRPRRSSSASSVNSDMDWDPPFAGDRDSICRTEVEWEDIEKESGDKEDSGECESKLESKHFCTNMVWHQKCHQMRTGCLTENQEDLRRRKGSCTRMPKCMSSGCHPTVCEPVMAVYGCLSKGLDWKGCCVGSQEAEGSSDCVSVCIHAVGSRPQLV